jgi:hypothetical protein
MAALEINEALELLSPASLLIRGLRDAGQAVRPLADRAATASLRSPNGPPPPVIRLIAYVRPGDFWAIPVRGGCYGSGQVLGVVQTDQVAIRHRRPVGLARLMELARLTDAVEATPR